MISVTLLQKTSKNDNNNTRTQLLIELKYKFQILSERFGLKRSLYSREQRWQHIKAGINFPFKDAGPSTIVFLRSIAQKQNEKFHFRHSDYSSGLDISNISL